MSVLVLLGAIVGKQAIEMLICSCILIMIMDYIHNLLFKCFSRLKCTKQKTRPCDIDSQAGSKKFIFSFLFLRGHRDCMFFFSSLPNICHSYTYHIVWKSANLGLDSPLALEHLCYCSNINTTPALCYRENLPCGTETTTWIKISRLHWVYIFLSGTLTITHLKVFTTVTFFS